MPRSAVCKTVGIVKIGSCLVERYHHHPPYFDRNAQRCAAGLLIRVSQVRSLIGQPDPRPYAGYQVGAMRLALGVLGIHTCLPSGYSSERVKRMCGSYQPRVGMDRATTQIGAYGNK
jgi:hypothetical protein